MIVVHSPRETVRAGEPQHPWERQACVSVEAEPYCEWECPVCVALRHTELFGWLKDIMLLFNIHCLKDPYMHEEHLVLCKDRLLLWLYSQPAMFREMQVSSPCMGSSCFHSCFAGVGRFTQFPGLFG